MDAKEVKAETLLFHQAEIDRTQRSLRNNWFVTVMLFLGLMTALFKLFSIR